MRVLAVGNVYPPHVLGGYEIVWQGAMEELRRNGHEVRVLTTDYRSPRQPANAVEDPDAHRELRWYWRDHGWPKIGPWGRLAIESHNAAVFDRHVATFRPDVLTWWPMGGMSLGLIERARRQGLPAVLFVHDYWPRYGPERDLWMRMWRHRRALGALVERLSGLPTRHELAAAGRWLFNSGCVLEDTRDAGFEIHDSGVLSPGIDASFLDPRPTASDAPWRGRLLYIGRVVEQKGVHTSIEALGRVSNATLRIVGEGDAEYRRRLERLAVDCGCADRVEFAPPVAGAAILDEYRAADAVMFPVQWPEPWGLVPLEAMALGTLVVATGQGGSGEFLVDGENSLLFAPGDPGALARSVIALADNPELRARLRRGGRETASRHTADRFNRAAREEIESAFARHAQSPPF